MAYMIDRPSNTADKMIRVAPRQMPTQVQAQPAVSPLVAELQEKLKVAQARVGAQSMGVRDLPLHRGHCAPT
jgi:hypothetical protein